MFLQQYTPPAISTIFNIFWHFRQIPSYAERIYILFSFISETSYHPILRKTLNRRTDKQNNSTMSYWKWKSCETHGWCRFTVSGTTQIVTQIVTQQSWVRFVKIGIFIYSWKLQKKILKCTRYNPLTQVKVLYFILSHLVYQNMCITTNLYI